MKEVLRVILSIAGGLGLIWLGITLTNISSTAMLLLGWVSAGCGLLLPVWVISDMVKTFLEERE